MLFQPGDKVGGGFAAIAPMLITVEKESDQRGRDVVFFGEGIKMLLLNSFSPFVAADVTIGKSLNPHFFILPKRSEIFL